MKNFITCLFLFFSFMTINAQSRIGSTLKAIKEEFPDSKYNIESVSLTDTSCIFTVKEEALVTIYLFDHSNCTATFIIPQTSAALKGYVEDYNKKYIIVSDKQWKAYLRNGICRIDLEFPENGNLPFFLWTRTK